MPIEKLLGLITLLSTFIGLYWQGAKKLIKFIDETNDSTDPKIWKLHNRVTGWAGVLITLGFTVIDWSDFLNESNYWFKVGFFVCGMFSLQAVVLFAVLQHMTWKREAYFCRPVRMGLLEGMV